MITPEEARKHLSLPPDGGGHGEHVTRLIAAAIEAVERYCGRALLNQTWRLSIDSFPFCTVGSLPTNHFLEIVLPRPPLVSISSIQYDDENGDEQTLDTEQYRVTTDREPARIAPAFGATWPTTRCQREAVRITFVAGYGATAASVPEPLRHAVLLIVGAWFNDRAATSEMSVKDVPLNAIWLMDGYQTGADPEWYRLAE